MVILARWMSHGTIWTVGKTTFQFPLDILSEVMSTLLISNMRICMWYLILNQNQCAKKRLMAGWLYTRLNYITRAIILFVRVQTKGDVETHVTTIYGHTIQYDIAVVVYLYQYEAVDLWYGFSSNCFQLYIKITLYIWPVKAVLSKLKNLLWCVHFRSFSDYIAKINILPFSEKRPLWIRSWFETKLIYEVSYLQDNLPTPPILPIIRLT